MERKNDINPSAISLGNIYDTVCEEYRRQLCILWDISFDETWWHGDKVGEGLFIADWWMPLSVSEIRHIVEKGVTEDGWMEYCAYCENEINSGNDRPSINFRSWFELGARPDVLGGVVINDDGNKPEPLQENNIPKIWNDIKFKDLDGKLIEPLIMLEGSDDVDSEYAVNKSVIASLKIHQLIEIGYGGNITRSESLDAQLLKYHIVLCYDCDGKAKFGIHYSTTVHNHIAFHTEEQAMEFLSYPANISLLKDYFMI